ncbi:MAG: cysteine--tRNA ligase [Actinobacteria bacterium]|nr:cysteine--tRNA ligase [Actinomycetota bacterium]
MGLKIYNTISRRKEDLVPREEGKISMYACGPTVYNYIHIGNARTFLNFDMIRRYLEFTGYDVTFVQNITDVDDKIINRANEEGISPEELAGKYLEAFNRDMGEMGVVPPDITPKATEHIEEMLKVIEGLVESGTAYVSEGDVYFDVSKFPGYGELSGRVLEDQQVTSQCDIEMERKKNPNDFALWKSSKPGEPFWESPWGPGRPGWHIECSTMSMKYLGHDFDIHGGGQDLIFPHHENERAQAEAYSPDKRFVKYWMHSGMLNIDKEKMSKSLGNIKSLREVLDEYKPDVIRMLMLGTHYRSPLNFSDDSLVEAKASLERLQNCMFNLKDLVKRLDGSKVSMATDDRETELIDYVNNAEVEFRNHMDDDFNSAAALGVVFNLVREVNAYVAEVEEHKSPGAKLVLLESERILEKLCIALGLLQSYAGISDLPSAQADRKSDNGPSPDELIELILDVRQRARERKDFESSDAIRDGLLKLGIQIEDGKEGSRWRLER